MKKYYKYSLIWSCVKFGFWKKAFLLLFFNKRPSFECDLILDEGDCSDNNVFIQDGPMEYRYEKCLDYNGVRKNLNEALVAGKSICGITISADVSGFLHKQFKYKIEDIPCYVVDQDEDCVLWETKDYQKLQNLLKNQ